MLTPRVGRILETSLYVADLDLAQGFYELVFAFPVLFRDARMCALDVPGRQALLLFKHGATIEPSETPFGTIPAHGSEGVQHLCFSIAQEDIARWQVHLDSLGIVVESRVVWPRGGTSLYFRDPDGHSLEVGTPGLWANDPIG
ncbi:VOC family protein [Acidisoma cellulosilytica]|uniref:VOC family protein n=1 Tax=Acidisoma cellulosilyticum TaxID=2802395 RepID=A0A964E5B8_9PROT|nr:VOC family protein [Acidisoma cellulosilyticum]MCB8882376.1 VOC family protein [Acidisoma cellulosilyticum]